MKIRIAFLATVLAVLILVRVALAQSGGPPGYVVKGTASGGRYHLVATH